jgi:hypothetical protein
MYRCSENSELIQILRASVNDLLKLWSPHFLFVTKFPTHIGRAKDKQQIVGTTSKDGFVHNEACSKAGVHTLK